MTQTLIKWCEHCRKNTHNDAECWSTRAMTYSPPYAVNNAEVRGAYVPPVLLQKLLADLKKSD